MHTQKSPIGLLKQSQKKLQKVNLKKVELTNTPELILSHDILNKIQYLCNRIHDVEWSGVLFYSVEGSIKNPDSLKLIVKDIYLMDKGSVTYTEYDTNSDLIGYIMNNKLHNYQRAHIHSHNSMQTFFSNTDMEELHDNSEFYNYYLSLIVNNAGDMTAKIAMRGKFKIKSDSILTYFNEDGKEVETKNTDKEDENVLFVLDCEVIKGNKISEDFKKLVEETINKIKEAKETINKVKEVKESKSNQFRLAFDNDKEVDVEKLLVDLLWDEDDMNLSLSETLEDLNKQIIFENENSKEDKEEYVNEVKGNIDYYFSGCYGREKENILREQIDMLSNYKDPIAKDVCKVLKEELKEEKENGTLPSYVYDNYNQYNY